MCHHTLNVEWLQVLAGMEIQLFQCFQWHWPGTCIQMRSFDSTFYAVEEQWLRRYLSQSTVATIPRWYVTTFLCECWFKKKSFHVRNIGFSLRSSLSQSTWLSSCPFCFNTINHRLETSIYELFSDYRDMHSSSVQWFKVLNQTASLAANKLEFSKGGQQWQLPLIFFNFSNSGIFSLW